MVYFGLIGRSRTSGKNELAELVIEVQIIFHLIPNIRSFLCAKPFLLFFKQRRAEIPFRRIRENGNDRFPRPELLCEPQRRRHVRPARYPTHQPFPPRKVLCGTDRLVVRHDTDIVINFCIQIYDDS